MAIAKNTIRRAIPITTTVIPDATLTNLTQITLDIAETITNFTSVFLVVNFQDVITATGGTINEHRVALRLGAAAYTTFTETDDITNSGENIAGPIGPIDFTAHFNANWVGNSMTVDTQVFFDQNTGTTLGMKNVSAELFITYEYNADITVNPVQTRTAKISLESLVGALPTVANTNFGTSQIPAFTGAGGEFDGVNNVVIKDYYFKISGNQASTVVTDFTISAAIDGGPTTSFGAEEHALATGCYYEYIYIPESVPDLSTTHNLQIWSDLANTYNHAAVDLFVTYTFEPTVGTKAHQSIELPIEIASPLGANTTADASRFTRDIFIQETNPVMKRAAFRIDFNSASTMSGLRFRAGSQAYRLYTSLIGVTAGMSSLQQRIDSGSAQGAGFTLARGKNTIVIDAYHTSASVDATNISGILTVNYLADIVTGDDIGAYNHTVYELLDPWNAQLLDNVRSLNRSFQIPNANYWLTGAGFKLLIWQSTAANGLTFDVEVLPGEAKGAGYMDIYTDVMQTDAERGCTLTHMRGRDVFKRYPQDPDPDRLNIETARDYRFFSGATSGNGMMWMVTYHGISYTTTLTIEGSAGGTIDIDVFRSDTDEKVFATSRVGNGTVDITWYDNTIPCYAVARESDALLMRSANFNFGD